MSLDSRHPTYADYYADWVKMGDVYKGSTHVKSKGRTYLPATSGMLADGMGANDNGYKAYQSYLMRAFFPDTFAKSVDSALGIMHRKPPTIELPAVMEPLRERITLNGESMDQLLMKINENQLKQGRLGLLVDVIDGVDGQPYIVMYSAPQILNWDDGQRTGIATSNLNLVVLDESEDVRKDVFDWEHQKKYRVLMLGEPQPNEKNNTAVYSAGSFIENTAFNANNMVVPSIRGTQLQEIPFTFINSRDTTPLPDVAPFLPLADLVLATYRLEADYRHSLFMQGQDTLVTMGLTGDVEELRVGAGSLINLPVNGDAKFIGVNNAGLGEVSKALDRSYQQIDSKSAELLNIESGVAESGDALNIRVSARTSSLRQVALVGAHGLEKTLKQIATWMSSNPDEVKVTPYLDFSNSTMLAAELRELLSAKAMGAPLSNQTIHDIMKDKGMTTLEFEEEMDLIETEQAALVSSNPDLDDEPEDEPDDE